MSTFLDKLKQDFIALLVGVLIGLPSLGLIVPQIFSFISQASNYEVSCLFRLFFTIYFTLPFLAFFFIATFMLKSTILLNMRKRISRFLVFIFLIFVSLLFMHGRGVEINDTLSIWGKFIIILSVLSLLYYIYSFIVRIHFLVKEFGLIHNNPILINQSAPQVPDNLPVTSGTTDEKDEYLVAIKFGILFLFIPIQLIIALTTTIFYKINESPSFIFVFCALYFIPFYIYQTNKALSGLKKGKKLSARFIPSALFTTAVLLSLSMIITKPAEADNKAPFDSEKNYNSLFINSENINKIDSELLHVNYINNLFALRKAADSLRKKINNDSLGVDSNVIKPYDSTLFDKKLIYDTIGKDSLTTKTFRLLAVFLFANDDTAGKKMVSFSSVYTDYLSSERKVDEIKAKKDLSHVVRNAQSIGITIFINTIIILLSFLLVLFFKDDQYNLDSVPEVAQVRKLLQIVFLIIAVLLIPLVKIVSEQDIKPEDPSTLFLLGNWNLSKSLGISSSNKEAADSLKSNRNQYCNCCPTIYIDRNLGDSIYLNSNDIAYNRFLDSSLTAFFDKLKSTIDKGVSLKITDSLKITLEDTTINKLIDPVGKISRSLDNDNKVLIHMDSFLNQIDSAYKNINYKSKKP